MRRILHFPLARAICWYLTLTLSGIAFLPPVAHAAFISPSRANVADMDAGALARVREALEDQFLQERLASLGLSPDEIRSRLDSLDGQERQAVLADVERIQAGGNGLGALVTLAVLVLLVLLILKLYDKEITIK
ncbi:MAG: PA2779 family protein [bacterium]|nr:MAG: PA2779 family protein [bacterium]